MSPAHARLLVPVAVLAVLGLAIAGWSTRRLHRDAPPPIASPPPAPIYAERVCGIGLLEPAGRAVRIGCPEPGVAVEVLAKEGDEVAAGDPLLRLDDRLARAELAGHEAAVALAVSERARLERMPRAEDLPPLAAVAAEAAARLEQARALRVRGDALAAQRLISEEDADSRRHAVAVAEAAAATAQAQLERAGAGAWKPDLEVAQARVAAAEAAVASARARLERLTVRAPRAAIVLAVHIRAGEFAQPAADGGLVVLGGRALELRLEVDESEAARLRPGAPARAWVRGIPDRTVMLEAVRTEPLAIGKRAFSGGPLEREDARVVQVLFRVGADAPAWLRPGMMMEAEIEAGTPP